jgi:uncharacterized protein (DUF433 family)
MAASQLERAVYSMTEVDRLLSLKSGTAQRWIDGYDRDGRSYPPVVREAHTGDALVTWGEFVECRFLAEYRTAGVPLIRMRPVVRLLRNELDVRYPLADKRLYVSGRELVEVIQRESDLAPELAIVVRTGQLTLAGRSSPPSLEWAVRTQRFLNSVEWDDAEGDSVVARVRPSAEFPAVAIDPALSFGAPTVQGIRTEVLAEEFGAGDPVELVARNHQLSVQQVTDAIGYELAA